MIRLMACGVAALMPMTAVSADTLPQINADAAATAAAAAALIAASGAPPSDFQTIPDYHLARIKHLPSGLVCSFGLGGRNRLTLSDGRLECSTDGAELRESWTATNAPQDIGQATAFARWTDRLIAETPGARPVVDGDGVDKLGIVRSLAARVAAERTSGWMSTDAGLAYYGVADAGRWRVTYHAAGKAEMVRLIGPMVWITGLDQIGGRKPLVKARAI
jgi:hypothetical protein